MFLFLRALLLTILAAAVISISDSKDPFNACMTQGMWFTAWPLLFAFLNCKKWARYTDVFYQCRYKILQKVLIFFFVCGTFHMNRKAGQEKRSV